MGSDSDYSDEGYAYDDDDEDMLDGTQDDGRSLLPSLYSCADLYLYVLEQSDDGMDMDGYNDDFKVAAKVKSKPYEIDYESLSQTAVEKLMQKDVDHICGIFGVDVCLSSCLYTS